MVRLPPIDAGRNLDTDVVEQVNHIHSLFNLGFPDEALLLAEKSLLANPKSADLWSNKGAILAGMDRREEALVSYDRAIELRPDYQRALLNKGSSLSKLGRCQEALTCVDQALALDRNEADAWVNRSFVLIKLNRWDDATESVKRGIELDKWIPQAWLNLAACTYSYGLIEDPESDLESKETATIIPSQETAFDLGAALFKQAILG